MRTALLYCRGIFYFLFIGLFMMLTLISEKSLSIFRFLTFQQLRYSHDILQGQLTVVKYLFQFFKGLYARTMASNHSIKLLQPFSSLQYHILFVCRTLLTIFYQLLFLMILLLKMWLRLNILIMLSFKLISFKVSYLLHILSDIYLKLFCLNFIIDSSLRRV